MMNPGIITAYIYVCYICFIFAIYIYVYLLQHGGDDLLYQPLDWDIYLVHRPQGDEVQQIGIILGRWF